MASSSQDDSQDRPTKSAVGLQPEYDALGLGCVAVDELLTVAAYPPADAKAQVLGRERRCGGNTATALAAAARLGARCAFAGVLGDDEASAFVRHALGCEGVDLTHLVYEPEARPIHAYVIAEQTRRTRTIFYDLTGARGAHPELPPEEVIRSTRVLLVDHFGVEGMTRAAQLARAAGIPVVADLECDGGPGFAGLLELVDHLILPQEFARQLTGAAEPAAAVNALWTSRRQVVAVTWGSSGCWWRSAEDAGPPRHQPAFAVQAVDTTGCGDVFHGAYAAALAWGWEVAARLQFAAAAAALRAARADCPTRQDVEALLAPCRSEGGS